ANSHVNYLAKLTDTLVDAGHDVLYLSPIMDKNVRGPGTTKPRILELPQAENAEYEKNADSSTVIELWNAAGWWSVNFDRSVELMVLTCNSTLNYPGLIDRLREEKIDAAYGESIDWCMAGLLHLAGIKNFAFTESVAVKDGLFSIHQVPNMPSYIPTLTGGNYGEDMTFFERAFNLFNLFAFERFNFKAVPMYQQVFEQFQPGFPSLTNLASQSSLVFLNSDPLVDFPHLSSARTIDVGGIAVTNGHKQLNETWSAIMELRPRTILFSFGTFAKAHGMPENYKRTVIETIKKFPDITFIWKYEKPEHQVSEGIPHLIEAPWLPQNDLLHDPRLTAFITHGGQGSITEANYAGVPLVVIPIIYDQARNAFQVKRNKLGVLIDKTELSTEGPFERAIREVLENPEYGRQAKVTAKMLADKPFNARELFVRNMEFLAQHGPLRQLDHYGKNLNFIQFYLIDVIGLVLLLIISIISLFVYSSIQIFKYIKQSIVISKIKTN
ncbi:hypothetical protein PFISCL1PPCAC_15298, partial [Pristionchus fissidentatus]